MENTSQLLQSSQNNNDKWIILWLSTMAITSAILVVVYTFVLIKIKAKFILITKIVVLMLIQNVASLFVAYLLWQQAEYQKDRSTIKRSIEYNLWEFAFAFFVMNASFIAAHWMFASEYYKISCQMPFVVNDDVIPEDLVTYNNRLYKVIMGVIFVVVLLQGIFNSLRE